MFSKFPNYQAAIPSLWQGRSDTQNNERFYQNIIFLENEKQLANKEKHTVFLGFASDAGITRNQGRPGAKEGPNAIKTQLAKLPCSNLRKYIDLGNITCEHDALESSQSQFAELISLCHKHGHKTFGFGGGHEIAWAHYQGLAPHYSNLGIINFDAHFDVRPYKIGQAGTSGTPFSQIACACQQNKTKFNYCCVGIQNSGNTQSLFQRAQELKVSYLTAQDLVSQNLEQQITFLDQFMQHVDHIYLSICLDVFAESYAPGVSAPQGLGLSPWQALPLLKHIVHTGKVVSIDMAELSPPLDQTQKTARLAALIIAELLNIK